MSRLKRSATLGIFLVVSACASTSTNRSLASATNDEIFDELQKQVVQNYVFSDASGADTRAQELRRQTEALYRQRHGQKNISSYISGGAGALAIGSAAAYLAWKNQAATSAKLKFLRPSRSLLSSLGSISLYYFQNKSNTTQAIARRNATLAAFQGEQDLRERIHEHASWVADFFALSPSETARFDSKLEEAVSLALPRGANIDSVDVLVKNKMLEPDFGGAVSKWRTLASTQMKQHPNTINEHATLYAELDYLAWSSSAMEAYLHSSDCHLSQHARIRMQAVIRNSDMMLEQAKLRLE